MAVKDDVRAVGRIDPVALKRRYAEERDKRIRPEGTGQYRTVFSALPHLLDDVVDRAPLVRDPISVETDVLVVGGGMSGLMTAGALRKNGVEDLLILDGAGDFGGTWYWNQYPGAQCDTEAYIYMPWLEEVGYVPTEKYARGPELFKYFKKMGEHFGLYEKTLFKTKARELRWDEDRRRWIVKTDRGDEIAARFVSLSVGGLSQPKVPGVPGLDTFKGKMFLTSRWDYSYTGGEPENPTLDKLTDKRVAIVGTGCTGVQAVPALAKWAQQLLVVQRTPSMINIRNNRVTDEDWKASLKPGWQDERIRSFEVCVGGPAGVDAEDLVADGWTRLSRSLFDLTAAKAIASDPDASPAELAQLADFVAMEENRARVSGTVLDPATAEALKPWYNVHCKRPTFHDDFLLAFNKPNVTLVDTSGRGVERVTETGIVVNGQNYEVDCLIFATGFEMLSLFARSGQFAVSGVGGRSLEEKLSKSFRTLHGVFTHDFPNMAHVGQVRDGGGSFNASYPFSLQATHVGAIFGDALRQGTDRIEVTQEAEEAWAQVMHEKAPPIGDFLAECTPGFLNNESSADNSAFRTALYGGGTLEYAEILKAWREGDNSKDLAPPPA